MRRMLGALGACAVLLAACTRHDTHQVSVEQAKWQHANLADYTFTYTEGGQAGPRSHDLRVVNGQPQTPPDGDVPATIDDVFRLLRNELSNADEVTATYDDSLGYPTSVSVDERANVADDEWSFSVTNFSQQP